MIGEDSAPLFAAEGVDPAVDHGRGESATAARHRDFVVHRSVDASYASTTSKFWSSIGRPADRIEHAVDDLRRENDRVGVADRRVSAHRFVAGS